MAGPYLVADYAMSAQALWAGEAPWAAPLALKAFIEGYNQLLRSLCPDEAVLFADAVHPTHNEFSGFDVNGVYHGEI